MMRSGNEAMRCEYSRDSKIEILRAMKRTTVLSLILFATICLLSDSFGAQQRPARGQRLPAGKKVLIVYLSRTNNTKAIAEIRKGRVEYKVEKAGIVQVPIGRVSFDSERLYENAHAIFESVVKARPASCKGRYLRNATLSSTMGPGIKLDTVAITKLWS